MLSSVHGALDNRVFHREARTLHRAGHVVTVFGVHDRDETLDGIEIRAVPAVPRWRRPLVWLRLLRIAREVDADVYHFHDPELLLVVPWLRRRGARTVYDVHEVNDDFVRVKDYVPRLLREPLARGVAWVEPRLAARHDAIVTADDEIAATFDDAGVPVTVLWNFPGSRFLDRAAADGPADRSSPAVVYLGAMEPNRGALLMAHAFALVRERIPEARLIVVGRFTPDRLERDMMDVAARLGVADAITVTGPVPYEQVADHLRTAAVGWVPWQPVSKNCRNVPTKLFEYLAWGLPVVASDLPATRKFLDAAGGGTLVEPTEPEAHAAAIVELLEDPAHAQQLADAGRRAVYERFNWAAIEHRLVDLYSELAPPSGTA